MMRKMNRKAEMQMTETIFVVFMVMIIILLCFVAYSKFQEAGIKEQQKEFKSAKMIETAHRLSFWPELECSEAGTLEFMCLDITKLAVLGDFINDSRQSNKYAFNYYYDLLQNSRITIIETYPSHTMTLDKDMWLLWNNTGKTRTADVVRVPVNLYSPITKTYAFGIMELQMFD